MTTSAALQVENLGPIDNYFFGTGQQDYSLFTYNTHRITPFSKNTVPVYFTDIVDFGKIVTASFPYSGDLINYVVLYFTLPQLDMSDIPAGSTYLNWTNAIGYSMIEYVEVLLGEFVISRQTGELMEILDYLSTPESKKTGKDMGTGRHLNINTSTGTQEIYVPLQFWFNKKLNASLPICALNNHSLKIRVKIRDFQECVTYDGNVPPQVKSITTCNFLADYYMLSETERLEFKNEEFVFIIEEYQLDVKNISANLLSSKYTLNIDRSIKELIIIAREIESVNNNDLFNYGIRDINRQGLELIKNIGLNLNGKTRFEKISESYYRLVTPQKYHTYSGNRNIYCIPFAETPEVNQPTGSINLSMYSNIELVIDYTPNVPESQMLVFGITNNILRIKNGMAQLEFLS